MYDARSKSSTLRLTASHISIVLREESERERNGDKRSVRDRERKCYTERK